MSSTCVRLVLLGTRQLSVPFQTELTIDTNIVVSDTHVVVTDTHTVVADTHAAVADTRTMVADLHRSVLTGKEDTSGNNHLVGATCHSPATKPLPLPRLKLGQEY